MKIYKISAEHEKYEACSVDFDACRKTHPVPDWEMLLELGGVRQGDRWWPRTIKRLDNLPLGDYLSNLNGDTLILKRSAVEQLKVVLGKIEILPLICSFGDYELVNVLDVLNCIDYENSTFKRFISSKKIMYFNKYAFHREQIADHHIFKIVDLPKSAIFVDEVFLDTVKKYKLTGFSFDLVWED